MTLRAFTAIKMFNTSAKISGLCVILLLSFCQGNGADEDKLGLAALSVGRFTSSMLAEMGKELHNDNIVINPVTIWSILAMVFPASAGTTKTEIAGLLNIAATNSDQVDGAYAAVRNLATVNSSQVESRIVNLVVNSLDITLNDDFVNRASKVFHAKQFSVDFSKQEEAARTINDWASNATNQRITDVIPSADFQGLSLLLGSAAYFKGKWKHPFARNATTEDKFKNDDDAIISPTIAMMRARAIYNYTYLAQLESQVIDIPYDDETSLLVILPRRKVRLQTVLENMRNKSLSELLPSESMSPEEVDLSLPKFSTSFSGLLNRPLYNLGVQTLLNPDAKLPKISDKAYITKVTHKAEIETNEEGTEASAVTKATRFQKGTDSGEQRHNSLLASSAHNMQSERVAHVVYKTTPISFQANRPFIYFVNHSPSRLVLFAGKYSEPRNT